MTYEEEDDRRWALMRPGMAHTGRGFVVSIFAEDAKVYNGWAVYGPLAKAKLFAVHELYEFGQKRPLDLDRLVPVRVEESVDTVPSGTLNVFENEQEGAQLLDGLPLENYRTQVPPGVSSAWALMDAPGSYVTRADYGDGLVAMGPLSQVLLFPKVSQLIHLVHTRAAAGAKPGANFDPLAEVHVRIDRQESRVVTRRAFTPNDGVLTIERTE